jgi:hypothetical protein
MDTLKELLGTGLTFIWLVVFILGGMIVSFIVYDTYIASKKKLRFKWVVDYEMWATPAFLFSTEDNYGTFYIAFLCYRLEISKNY